MGHSWSLGWYANGLKKGLIECTDGLKKGLSIPAGLPLLKFLYQHFYHLFSL